MIVWSGPAFATGGLFLTSGGVDGGISFLHPLLKNKSRQAVTSADKSSFIVLISNEFASELRCEVIRH
jgi:hypothetical protein